MCAGISAGQPEARGALVLVSSRLSCFFFSFQVFHPVFFSFFFFQIRRGKQSEGEDANESMRKRPTEGGRSTQDSDTDGAVVPNMWLVQLDNGVLYVPVIDWLSDPVPVADWLRWRRSPTEVSSSGQEEDSKAGVDQGAVTSQVKTQSTVPLFADVFVQSFL